MVTFGKLTPNLICFTSKNHLPLTKGHMGSSNTCNTFIWDYPQLNTVYHVLTRPLELTSCIFLA